MMLLDKAQRKLLSGFLEKLAVALATAIGAMIFFNGDELTLMTLYAAILSATFLLVGLLLVRGTDEKASPQQAQQTPPPAVDRTVRGRRKRK